MLMLEVNGSPHPVQSDAATPLLYVLRDELGLNGAKFGCGLGQCGACTVMLDGEAVFSCLTPVAVAAGRRVTTVEGLGTVDHPGPLQRAFIEEQAAQCGYCIAGMMMRAQALLARTGTPDREEIRRHMSPNLCRCGTHMRILRAVERAAVLMREARTAGGSQA
jgi:aerobic-type carbon monoxide dehydrogenase small subunit (CoxS/CutS family)